MESTRGPHSFPLLLNIGTFDVVRDTVLEVGPSFAEKKDDCMT